MSYDPGKTGVREKEVEDNANVVKRIIPAILLNVFNMLNQVKIIVCKLSKYFVFFFVFWEQECKKTVVPLQSFPVIMYVMLSPPFPVLRLCNRNG